MATTEAQKRASQKYRDKNYVRVPLDVRPEMKDKIVLKAKEKGLSTQGYILDLVKKDIGEE